MIIITGATGNIGSKLTQDLLARGRKVRCIARSADKLNQFTEQGAEAAAISLEQTDALTEAFSGAEVLFAMIPPNYAAPDFIAYMDAIGSSLVSAIRDSDRKSVV